MSGNLELRVTLETVTPLFLGGAKGKNGPPELRPPAFRGAMRYWLRAALGGVMGDDVQSMTSISKIEGNVFGDVGEGDTGSASAIITRIANARMPTYTKFQRQSQRNEPPTGRDYLYWSMFVGGNAKHYPAGGVFDFILNLRPGAPNPERILQYAASALWLLVHLGGIGARSRRTAGSLSVLQKQQFQGLQFGIERGRYADMADQFAQTLRQIRTMLGEQKSNLTWNNGLSEYDILHPQVCRIWILGAYRSSEQAVRVVGERLRSFRNRRDPDHRNVAKWLQGRTIPTVARAAFGLPLGYRYSNGPQGTIRGKLGRDGIERRSSPLWLSVSKIAPELFIATATLFKSRFLPEREQLYAKGAANEKIGIAPPADYSLIEQWIAESFSRATEVHYD